MPLAFVAQNYSAYLIKFSNYGFRRIEKRLPQVKRISMTRRITEHVYTIAGCPRERIENWVLHVKSKWIYRHTHIDERYRQHAGMLEGVLYNLNLFSSLITILFVNFCLVSPRTFQGFFTDLAEDEQHLQLISCLTVKNPWCICYSM